MLDQKKPISWIGLSKKDFMEFPHEVRNEMGHAWVNITYMSDEDYQAEVAKRKTEAQATQQ